jgi:hypothetical protein
MIKTAPTTTELDALVNPTDEQEPSLRKTIAQRPVRLGTVIKASVITTLVAGVIGASAGFATAELTPGPAGAQGAQGARGATGEQGPQGPRGKRGPIGKTGAIGATGAPGAAGVDGVDGLDGLDGRDGGACSNDPDVLLPYC